MDLSFDLGPDPLEPPRPGARPPWKSEGQGVKAAIIRWLEEQC